MSIIQFSHANGFPAKTYSVLFKHLEGHKISAINILAENRKPSEINWHDMTEDILKCAGQFEEPVVGVGHSLGGVLTLMAAAKKPALFQDIIILDPPLFSSQKRLLISILRAINIEDWVSPSGKSKNRRSNFESKEKAHRYFQANKMFNNFHPQTLKDYVTHGLIPGKQGVELTITVEQEVAIFHKMLTSYPKSIYKVRGTLVYTVKTPVLWGSDLRWIKRNFTQLKLIPFPDSHLFPLNDPESTAQIINRCLKYLN